MASEERICLKHNSPAEKWEDAIPMGNGFLGAMVYGHTSREKIQFNEDSLWYGTYSCRLNPRSSQVLPEVRHLIREGRIKEVEELMFQYMVATPCNMRPYVPLGELDIALNRHLPFLSSWMYESDYDSYSSELDLMSGILRIEHTWDGIRYTRESFISFPDRVFCYQLKSSKKDAINLDVILERCHTSDEKEADGRRPGKFLRGGGWPGAKEDSNHSIPGNILLLKGRASDVSFVMGVKMLCDGECRDAYSQLLARGSSQVTLYVAAATSNRYENPEQEVLERLEAAQMTGYDRIKEEHCRDFRSYMERCLLEIPGHEREQQYFQFNRYLLMSCGREGSAAMNLQGIWNADFTPPWDCKYTININTQMNYWPVDAANLPELNGPLFELLHKMWKKGKETARVMYGCRGMVCHHNTDFYGDCAPQDWYPAATFWPTGGAWLGLHIWEHYLFTLDKEFLKKEYPILQDLALFFVDYLIEDENGWLVTCPSVSPENRYILPDGYDTPVCSGPAMDNQILRTLFRACLDAAEILGIQEENEEDFWNCMKKLRPDSTGSRGQLLEWDREYPELTPGMGHVSHLWGAYPGNEINWETSPELMQAVRKSLEIRMENGAGSGGWPLAWQICLWARLLDGNMTDVLIRRMIENSASRSLLNAGGVFQIDGNLGALAGMQECLLQSHLGLHFLPALPKSWTEGIISGIRARGDITADLIWKNSRLQKAVLITGTEHEQRIIGTDWLVLCEGKTVPVKREKNSIRLKMEKGKRYMVTPL